MSELNFTEDSLKLLDSISVPCRIINNKKIFCSNTESENTANIDINSIFDKSCVSWIEESFSYIKIRDHSVRMNLKQDVLCEHMIVQINYNDNPCHLVMTNFDCKKLSFKNCIDYINNRKGIEKILIVDDDPLLIQLYEMILEVLKYEAFIFSSPVEVMNVIESLNFDLFISDYIMPEINGMELISKLKEVKPGIPAILSSGKMDINKDLFRFSGEENHVLFLSKPLTVKKIGDMIEVIEFISKLCSFCREAKSGW